MLAFEGKRRLGENDKLLQGHGATYHIISFQTVTCISTWQRSLLQQFVLPLFTSLMTSFLKACFADVYSTWLGSIRRRLPHTTQTQAPISPFCLWRPQKNLTFSTIMFCEVSFVIFGLRSLMLASKFQAFYSFQTFIVCCKHNGVIRKAGFWNNRKKRGFWNSWRKCPKRVVPV